MDATQTGDVIVLSPGTWAGFSVSGKSLTVRSTGSFATTCITGNCFVSASPNGFEFENLTLIGNTLNVYSTFLMLDRVRSGLTTFSLFDTPIAIVDAELNSSSVTSANPQHVEGLHAIVRSAFRNNAVFGANGSLEVSNSQFFACGNPINVNGSVTISDSEFQGGRRSVRRVWPWNHDFGQ